MADQFATVKFNVEHNVLKVAKMCLLTSDSIGSVKAQFNLKTSDWDNVIKIAIFKIDEKQYIKTLSADCTCFIPGQVLEDEGMLYVGLMGIADGFRITTNNVMLKVFEGSYDDDLPELDLSEQYFEIVMKELANKVDKTVTIAGLELNGDIARDELLEALDIQGGGSSGSGGFVYWKDVLNKPTSLSQFADDLGSDPLHTHSQYLSQSDELILNGGGA